ncbi:MAG TPA: cell division protein ZapA [bacterium]|nr:cell division protein ZapA [Candidatus Omnitrophota bacterium]HOJ59828.1 cell division protein ZapA [bacterium]HPP02361.1 cell division protein ZapA [bacterium]HXK96041.1 cell division protein ZapA [bacterium]
MAGDSSTITVEILGTRLQLRGGENPQAVRQVCEYVRARVQEIANHSPTAPALQIALLAAINIADDLRLAQRQDELLEAAAEKAGQILDKTIHLDDR